MKDPPSYLLTSRGFGHSVLPLTQEFIQSLGTIASDPAIVC